MHQKGGRAAIAIGIITLIVLVFILFSTIYNQIIAQNEGFFYILIFGGILVLVFVLMSLITKLIAISPQGASSIGYTIIEIVLMIAIGFFFLYKRFSLVNSLPPDDALFFRVASFLTEGTLKGSLDVVTKSLINPTDYAYAILLAIVFKFTSVNPGAVVYLNAALLIMIAVFAAHTAQAVGGRICGFIAFAVTLFIPSQSYVVYSYNSVLFFTMTVLLSFDLYVHIYLAEEPGRVRRILLDGLLAVSGAVMLATEPASVIFVILMILHYLIFSRDSIKAFFITFSVFLLVFFILLAIKSAVLGVPFSEVFRYFGMRFRFASDLETGTKYELSEVYENFQNSISNQNKSITDNYIFLFDIQGGGVSPLQASWLQLSSSLFYMFALVLSISCVVFLFKNKSNKAIPSMLMTTGVPFVAFIKAMPDGDSFYIFELLIILACAGLSYMYENQHPEAFVEEDIWSVEKKEEEEEEEEELSEEEKEEQLRRARALIFIGEDDDLYKEIKKEEEEQKKEGAGKNKEVKKKGAADKKQADKSADAENEEDKEAGKDTDTAKDKDADDKEKTGKPVKKKDKAEKTGKKSEEKSKEKSEEESEKKPDKKSEKKSDKKQDKSAKPGLSAKYDDFDDYGDYDDFNDDDFNDDYDDYDGPKDKSAKNKGSEDKAGKDNDKDKSVNKKASGKDKKKPKKGEPLENPVPMPKKHTAKSLDFDDESFDDMDDDMDGDDDFSDDDYDDSWD